MILMPRLRAHRSLRTFVLCCLLVALPVVGLAGSIVQVLGVQHSHDRDGPGAGAGDAMSGWQDFRRVVATSDAAHHGHGHAHGHDDLRRHHHAHDDTGVASLGSDGADSALAGVAGSAAGFAGGLFPPVAARHWCAEVSAHEAWQSVRAAPIVSCPPRRLDRPPKS